MLTKKDAGIVPLNAFEWVTLGLFFVCLNASAIKEYDQFPALTSISGRGWQIVSGYLCVLILVGYQLRRNGLFKEYIASWGRSRLLLLFMGISIASLAWSVYPLATLYEVTLLYISTMLAAYFALRLRLAGTIEALTWIAAICTALSLLIVFFTPIGIMQGAGHAGSWRGLFWHRNHTGILMAFFNLIFLARLVLDPRLSQMGRAVAGLFYFLTVIHVFGSRSATGILIFLVLNFATASAYVWLKQRARLQAWHYYLYAAMAILALAVFIIEREFFFGILGRSASMTGRTSMWPDLIQNTFLQKPVLGHGFGAIWMQESFRMLVEDRWGWSYQPYFADNGYLDILLNLGALGLLVFLLVFVSTGIHSIQRVKESGSWMYVFIILTLLFVMLSNLTYSFLFEVDYFVWSLVVFAAFLLLEPEACWPRS